MSREYKARGIVLKGSPLKENDRLVTILTPEYGLIKAVVPGAKKIKSSLRGRSELFVVNNFLLVRGRSLDKIIQAETVYTYPDLSQDLGKLASAQYFGELALYLAVDSQPQPQLYELLGEHLRRIERLPKSFNVYPYLAQGLFHFLAISGIVPQVQSCCVTNKILDVDKLDSQWLGGFSFEYGGAIDCLNLLARNKTISQKSKSQVKNDKSIQINYSINGLELAILQRLSDRHLPQNIKSSINDDLRKLDISSAWIRIENILRKYIENYLNKSIRSADLIDNLYLVDF